MDVARKITFKKIIVPTATKFLEIILLWLLKDTILIQLYKNIL